MLAIWFYCFSVWLGEELNAAGFCEFDNVSFLSKCWSNFASPSVQTPIYVTLYTSRVYGSALVLVVVNQTAMTVAL